MALSGHTIINVAEEQFDAALPEMVALLNETRSRQVSSERFDWLYRRNPDGPARIWAIREESTDAMVGFTACLPRRVVVDGEMHFGWNGADFSIDPRYRTLGPAVRLRRQARLAIEAGQADFLYSHPNQRMATVHRLVGHTPVGWMVRLARPLEVGSYLADRTGSPRLGRLARKCLDPLMRLASRERWSRATRGIRFVPHIRFDERFDELFERNRQIRRVVGVRDAAYLNWRYAENPLFETHALVAEKGERVLGYILLMDDGGMGQIKDLFPADDPSLVDRLFDAAVRTCWSLGLRSLSMALLEESPLLGVLRHHGFHLRSEASQMFAFCPDRCGYSQAVYSPGSWFLNSGDRDV